MILFSVILITDS